MSIENMLNIGNNSSIEAMVNNSATNTIEAMANSSTISTIETMVNNSIITAIDAMVNNSSMTDEMTNSSITTEAASIVEAHAGLFTKEEVARVKTAINCYCIPPVVLFGLIGNILSIIILTRKSMRHGTTNMVLVYLAFIDTLYLAMSLFRKISCLVGKFDKTTAYMLDMLSISYPVILKIIFARISNLCSLVICIERFIAVYKPLKVKLWITRQRMVGALIATTLLVWAALMINMFVYSVTWYYDTQTNRSLPLISLLPLYTDNRGIFQIYNSIFLSVLLRLLPCTVIVALTLAIILKLRRRRDWLHDVTNQNESNPVVNYKETKETKELRSVTYMLMTIVVIFIICLIPGNMAIIAGLVDKRYSVSGVYRNEFRALASLSTFAEIINASANFLVYVAMNKKFSAILVQMLCCRNTRPRNVMSRMSSELTVSTVTVSQEVNHSEINQNCGQI